MSKWSHATPEMVRRASIIGDAECNDLTTLDVLREHREATR